MPFLEVALSSFRNLEDGTIGLEAAKIFLVGENGQGKTNFLEALYYLSYGSSFRGQVDGEAARRGSSGFGLAARCHGQGSKSSLPADEIRVSFEGRGKHIRLNDKPVRDRKELLDINPCVVFCHEDFEFAAGEPERRRFFFDQTASLVFSSYIDDLREYKRILRQRNAALKEQRQEVLELLDELIVGAGLRVMSARRTLQISIDRRFASRFEAVSLLGQEVRIHYRPSWAENLGIDEHIKRLGLKRREELAIGTSLSGPHRDRWSFYAQDRDFAATASTGQLRLLSLTLRMVQAEHYQEETDKPTVLLLDDVLLELDRAKRARFLDLLPLSGQAIFTFLPGENWEDYRGHQTLVYEVRNGRFSN